MSSLAFGAQGAHVKSSSQMGPETFDRVLQLGKELQPVLAAFVNGAIERTLLMEDTRDIWVSLRPHVTLHMRILLSQYIADQGSLPRRYALARSL
jgi:hypothetical protein